jgi:hypothetical protein
MGEEGGRFRASLPTAGRCHEEWELEEEEAGGG